MYLREAKIILPTSVFEDDTDLFQRFTRAITEEYGGYTMTTGTGADMDDQGDTPNEAVYIFTIAMLPEDFEEPVHCGPMGFIMAKGEESVYLVDTYGDVHIMTADDAVDMAEATTMPAYDPSSWTDYA